MAGFSFDGEEKNQIQFSQQMNFEIEVKAINLKDERFERIYFAWLRMGIAIFAFTDFPIRINQNLYHGCVPGWSTNIHYFSIPNTSRYALLCWIPYIWIQFSRANLFSVFSTFVRGIFT